MSQWYRVTLRPLQSLLLGGYHTHGRVDVDPIRSPVYFSKSLMLPQQTTVWGMFRKYLLDVYGLLKTDWNYSSEDRKRHQTLIGTHFGNVFDDKEYDGGIILQMSPVFIAKGEEDLKPCPLDKKVSKDGKIFEHQYEKYIGAFDQPYYCLKRYRAKEGLSAHQVWIDGKRQAVRAEDIFRWETSVGIHKRLQLETPNNMENHAFYKQKRILLNDDFSYAFYIQLKDNIHQNEMRSIIELGADQRKCELHIKKCDTPLTWLSPQTQIEDEYWRIVLLSDTYLPASEIEQLSDFRVVQTVQFGTLQSSNRKSRRAEIQYELLSRGSVLLASKEKGLKVIEAIQRYKKARKLGFNQFEITKWNIEIKG